MLSRIRKVGSAPRTAAFLVAASLGFAAINASSVSYAVTANIFGNVVPALPNAGPEGGAEIGTYFTSSVGVTIKGFRWYAGPQTVANQSGAFTGKLWLESDQSLVAFQDFATLTNGWNEVLLTTPVPIPANTGYVASINHQGRYPFDSNGGAGYFPKGTAPVSATRSGFAGSGLFPVNGPFPATNGGASYFVDVIFDSPLVTGDVNGDFVVNLADYMIIRNNFFKTSQTFAQGDLNLTGTVDFDDFRIWKTSFPGGVEAAEAALANIPEPASAGMLTTAIGMLWWGRRRMSRVA